MELNWEMKQFRENCRISADVLELLRPFNIRSISYDGGRGLHGPDEKACPAGAPRLGLFAFQHPCISGKSLELRCILRWLLRVKHPHLHLEV